MEITEEEIRRLLGAEVVVNSSEIYLVALRNNINNLIQEKLRRYIVKGFEPK